MVERWVRRNTWFTVTAVFALIVVLWFVGVQRSVYLRRCPRCGSYTVRVVVSVFGVGISENRLHSDSMIEEIARDLGVPCRHVQARQIRLRRQWGLLICACPCRDGTFALSGNKSEYTPQMKRRAIEIGRKNPDLAHEYFRRVIVGRDPEWLTWFLDQLRNN